MMYLDNKAAQLDNNIGYRIRMEKELWTGNNKNNAQYCFTFSCTTNKEHDDGGRKVVHINPKFLLFSHFFGLKCIVFPLIAIVVWTKQNKSEREKGKKKSTGIHFHRDVFLKLWWMDWRKKEYKYIRCWKFKKTKQKKTNKQTNKKQIIESGKDFGKKITVWRKT